jgi:FtsH-binding integral membrane protein
VRHNLKFRSAENGQLWWKFGLQILPVLLLGGILLAITFALMPPVDNPILTVILAAITMILFIAMLTFREQQGWNLPLYLGFSVSLGAVIASLGTDPVGTFKFEPLWLVLPCLGVGAIAGSWLGSRSGEIGVILWLVCWVYLLGWAALIFLQLDPVFYLTWSAVGLVLFTGLAAIWFSHMADQLKQQSSISAAIDLYLICINLYLAATILLSVEL